MKILLDENLDWRLRRLLPGHEVESVAYIGWSGIKNGVLLRRAVEHRYEILLTMDGNMLHQQDIAAHAPRARINVSRPECPFPQGLSMR